MLFSFILYTLCIYLLLQSQSILGYVILSHAVHTFIISSCDKNTELSQAMILTSLVISAGCDVLILMNHNVKNNDGNDCSIDN